MSAAQKLQILAIFQLLFVHNVCTPLTWQYASEGEIQSIEKAKPVSSLRWVAVCGQQNYSSAQIQTLLKMYRFITKDPSKPTIQWDRDSLKKYRFSPKNFKKLPQDIQNFMFLCTAFEDIQKLNVFTISADTVDEVYKKFQETQSHHKTKDFTEASLRDREKIAMILRALKYKKMNEGLPENFSLFSIPFAWKTK